MFDHVVLTASNEGQADAYRAELAHRGLDAQSTPAATVVADPGGRRVGSGISTLLVLQQLAAQWAHDPADADSAEGLLPDVRALFARKRVCIIHAGGDSRRLPAYAAHGKIFTPLPIDAPDPRHATLFDLLLADLSRIPLPDEGRVVVATGDVYLDIGMHPLGFAEPGVMGVAWASTPERGSRHGVYRIDGEGLVTGFLHKPTPSEAAEAGALRDDDTELIDTGVVCLDPATVEHWLQNAGGVLESVSDGGLPQIDLYGDILPAMAHRRTLHGVDWLGAQRFGASVVPTCPFLHIGSSRELLDVLTDPIPQAEGWTPPEPGGQYHRILNTRLHAPPATLGERVLIESSELVCAPTLVGDNIVVGVPPELDAPLRLTQGWGIVCLPVHDPAALSADRWVAVCFGDRDDFKTPLRHGGTFGNTPLAEVLERAGLETHALWRDDDHSLWSAALWTPTAAADMLTPIEWMLRSASPPAGWHDAPRLSLAEVMASVDHARLLEARDRVLARV